MPQQPDAGYTADIDVDDTKKWIVRLEGVDEKESGYRDKRKDAMYLTHRFTLFDVENGAAVTDNTTGEIYELWQNTNDLTFDNPKTNKIAASREIMNALAGHRLTDDEVREMLAEGWGTRYVGSYGMADLEWKADNAGVIRLKIMRLRPYKKEKKQKAPVAPPPPPSDEDDDDDD